MHLQQADIEQARKVVANLDRSGRHWITLRWLMLLVALGMLGIAVYGYIQIERLAKNNTSTHLIGGSHVAEEQVGTFTDVRINLLRIESRLYVGLIFDGCVGGALLAFVLTAWNRHVHNRLKARLIERVIDGETATGTEDS